MEDSHLNSNLACRLRSADTYAVTDDYSHRISVPGIYGVFFQAYLERKQPFSSWLNSNFLEGETKQLYNEQPQ